MFHFDIVHGCQLRCIGCPNSTLLPKIQRIEIDDFERCMNNVDVDHVHTLRLFNFGEPLLHRNLSGIFQVIKRQRWAPDNVEISTNGQRVYWDDFEEALKLGVLTRLVVSCDGDGSPEAYERLRPPGKWDKFIEFLERSRELRDRHAPELELMTRSIVQSKQDALNWKRVLEPRGWNAEFRTWKALPEAKENMTGREIKPAKGICTFVAPSERFSHLYHGQLNQLYADWDGTVVPCCVHPKAAVLGNLKEQTYNEILRDERRKHFLALLEKDRKNMPICGICEYGPPENPGPSFADSAPELEEMTV
ncbi:MAG: SPASM domain-containing protein [Xanthomonadales bacterium]|nr:SPASM domain-containing protein [Xanthomonadales bacterium]